MTTVLILLGDRSLKSIFLIVFELFSMTQQHLQLLNTSHIYLSYKTLSKDKLNHVLGTKPLGTKLESISSVEFNGKIINMMLPSKICINFHTQVFHTFRRIQSFPHNSIFKSPSSFFCLDLKITITVFFTLSEILFAFNQYFHWK